MNNLKKIISIMIFSSTVFVFSAENVGVYTGTLGEYVDLWGQSSVRKGGRDILKTVSPLSILNLSGTSITSLGGVERIENPQLITVIVLNNNNIASNDPWLYKQPFKYFPNVQDIFLDFNKLTTLPADLFKDLNKLKQIRIHNNEIAELPRTIFDVVPSLERLEVYDNRFKETEAEFRQKYLSNHPNVMLVFEPQKR